MNYQTMNFEQIFDYCKKNNELEWLKKLMNTPINNRKITFIEIKKAFAEKFMPEIIPQAKPKKPSMFDIINSL